MMVLHDFNQMLECAEQIAQAADRLELQGMRLEQRLYEQRRSERWLLFFQKSTRDLDQLVEQRVAVVDNMRNQSLFIKESVRRYRGAQSRTVKRAQRPIT